MIEEILCILQFALYPSSPYSIGKQILCESGNEILLSRFYYLLDGVCMSCLSPFPWCVDYNSIRYCPKSIAYTCLLVVWFYSFEDKSLPSSLTVCLDVYLADALGILSIAKDSFPMLNNACHLAETELSYVVFLAVAPPLFCVVFVGNRVAKFKNGRVQQKRLHDLVLHDGDFVWRDANGRHGVFIVDGNLHGIVSR